MLHDDVTLIIQGPVSHNGKLGKGILNIPTYKKFVGKIIISTWILPELKPSKRFLINNDVTYLEDSPSKYESFFNWHNVNYQTVTSLNGVNKTKTPGTNSQSYLVCQGNYGSTYQANPGNVISKISGYINHIISVLNT